MNTKVKEFITEYEINNFLSEKKEDKAKINLCREYIDLKITWDNYSSQRKFYLIYKTNEDKLDFWNKVTTKKIVFNTT